MDREILHIDMNNFFASVECLYRPELKNVPMAVAGDKEHRHGIVLAKNMLAKAKGVKTAEPLWEAQRKCPGIVFVPPHIERYHHYSQSAMAIYARYTDQIESFGLDECWLDVTGSRRLFGTGREIAEEIRARVKAELGLTVSVGVSFNKTFAKLGSDYKKPDALTEITRENFRQLLWPLPSDTLLYVGASTKSTLQKYAIRSIGDIAKTDKSLLIKLFGKGGAGLWESANGMDNSPVANCEDAQEIKSISNMTTTAVDLKTKEQVRAVLLELAESVAHRLRSHELWARGVQISIRRNNLDSYQRSCTLEFPVADSKSLLQAAFQLYLGTHEKIGIRTLGLRAERLTGEESMQCSLFGEDKCIKRQLHLEEATDLLKAKYGDESVRRALLCPSHTEDKGCSQA